MTLRQINDEWAGDDIDDLIAYFAADPNGYAVHQVVVARCAHCAGQVFVLETDESSTCVRRTCANCDRTAFMLDAEEHWLTEEPEVEYFVECTCGEDRFETAVGFTFYNDTPDSDVRWVSIAVRCTVDGLLGYCADYKIRYGPSHHLVDAV